MSDNPHTPTRLVSEEVDELMEQVERYGTTCAMGSAAEWVSEQGALRERLTTLLTRLRAAEELAPLLGRLLSWWETDSSEDKMVKLIIDTREALSAHTRLSKEPSNGTHD